MRGIHNRNLFRDPGKKLVDEGLGAGADVGGELGLAHPLSDSSDLTDANLGHCELVPFGPTLACDVELSATPGQAQTTWSTSRFGRATQRLLRDRYLTAIVVAYDQAGVPDLGEADAEAVEDVDEIGVVIQWYGHGFFRLFGIAFSSGNGTGSGRAKATKAAMN
jgi:hypothetical protein